MAKKVLLIEDEPDLLTVTTVRLKHAGYEVIAVGSAEEALVFLRKEIPDCILLDLLLPKMQGEDFCKVIKADPRCSHIPIVIFTANASFISSPEKVKELGADDLMSKPFDHVVLIQKIKDLIP